ncbi:MAG: hypothetical protein HOO67_03155 [Candidatus Peribacteraceae bacterium]|nr:hypothetical protein [Candidatus Peribacteraceae bacterium]
MIEIESLLPSNARDSSVIHAAKTELEKSGRGEKFQQVFGGNATVLLQELFRSSLEDYTNTPGPLTMEEIAEAVDIDLSWQFVSTIYFPEWKPWYKEIHQEALRTIPKTMPTGSRSAFRKAKVLERIKDLDPGSLQALSERILLNKNLGSIQVFQERLNDKINVALADPGRYVGETSKPRHDDVQGEDGLGITPRSKLRKTADRGYSVSAVNNQAASDTGVAKQPKRSLDPL